jgi:hypothetical protein
MMGERLRYGYRQFKRGFHFLVGLAFLCLAALGAALSLAEWRTYLTTPSAGAARLAIFTGFTALLVLFGLYSFVKARSVR